MKLKKILFKISGDLIHNKKVLNEIKEEAKDKLKLVSLIYGFGTIFSKVLNEAKIPFRYINGIRETREEGLKIGLNISKEIKKYLKKSWEIM